MLIATAILAGAILAATVLPFLPLAHGVVRVGDFPRQQFLVLAGLLLALSIFLSDHSWPWVATQVVLAGTMLVQFWMIAEFTPLVRKQSARFDPDTDKGGCFRLVAANVKEANDRHADMAAEIGKADPDIMILMEVDAKWRGGLSELLKRYPTVVDRTQENSYGMIVATRFAFEDVKVECLLTDGVPSVIGTMRTPEGRRFRLYSIHPEPPVPHRGTEGRDGETSLVALKVRDETLPVIVTGDLNDVAWSKTTRRFRRVSGLLDPRIGRKIFSTFDARLSLLRWPLDHLFHSAEFRLVDMQRLKPCGSDHFPVQFDLAICSDEDAESRPEHANGDDIERAEELVVDARERDEDAIGTDWEK